MQKHEVFLLQDISLGSTMGAELCMAQTWKDTDPLLECGRHVKKRTPYQKVIALLEP